MQVTVSRRHTEVPENLRVMTEEKIGRLTRFVDGLDHAEVHFWEHKNPRIADKEVCEGPERKSMVMPEEEREKDVFDQLREHMAAKKAAEEAADRMELVGHGFFFFTNVDTSRAAVVYRRDDGDVGLIDEAD